MKSINNYISFSNEKISSIDDYISVSNKRISSIDDYINEKLKISKSTDTSFYKILDIVNKYNLESIDNYNNELLVPGLYIDDDNVVDNIEFNDDEITIFYINDNDEEGDATFSHDEWYDYFDEDVTKSIYNHLTKNIKK